MSFLVLHGGGMHGVATARHVIKRADAKPVADALALLREAEALRAQIGDAAEEARQKGRAEGLAEARREATAALAQALERIGDLIDAAERARRETIAEAAFAAVRAIFGRFDDAALVDQIVDATLQRLGDGPFTIHVAPAVAPHLTRRAGVEIAADVALGESDCRITGPDGTVIASLDVQLDALAARWGLAA